MSERRTRTIGPSLLSLGDWATAIELPGIVPVNGVSRMSPFAPLADPTFYNLDTDFGDDPLPKGDKTIYQLETTRTGLMRRAWITWGWGDVDLSGTIRLQHNNPYGEVPIEYGLTTSIMIDATLGGMIIPPAKNAALWSQYSALGGVDRQHAYDNPTYLGANRSGNIATEAHDDLNWVTPLQGSAWKTLADVEVGPAGKCYYVISVESPAVFGDVNHSLRIQGRFYGNTGCVRDTSKKYFSIVHLELRAFWMPDKAGFDEEVAAAGSYSFLALPDLDASDWVPPRPAVFGNAVPIDFFGGWPTIESGSIHFNSVSSGYYGQANFAGNPTIWGYNQPMSNEPDVPPFYPEIAITVTFKNPFHWSMPLPL